MEGVRCGECEMWGVRCGGCGGYVKGSSLLGG